MSAGLHSLAVIPVIATISGLVLPVATLAASPDTLHASPSGRGTVCSAAAPCRLATAIRRALTGDSVAVAAGNYGSARRPLTTTLMNHSDGIDVVGELVGTMPVIHTTAARGLVLTGGSSVRQLKIVSSGATSGLEVGPGGTADHVIVLSSAGTLGACSVSGSLTDALCVATGANEAALGLATDGDLTASLRGVTAEATGNGGVGLRLAQGGTPGDVSTTITNSIIHGQAFDATVAAPAGGTSAATFSNSDLATTLKVGAGGTETITLRPSDVTARPQFVNAAAGNFRVRATSPTIDRGAPDGTDTDLAGRPRTLGSAPDLGAFEYAEKPTVAGLKLASPVAPSVQATIKVNPEGLPTQVQLIARHDQTQVASTPVDAGDGRSARTMSLTLTGLAAATTYKVHAVATNAAGHTSSSVIAVRPRQG